MFLRGKPLAFVESDVVLCGRLLLLFGFGISVMNSSATALDGLLGRLASCIELPVASRALVRRVAVGWSKKRSGHLQILLSERTASGAEDLRKSCSSTSSAGDVCSRSGTHFLMDGFQHTVREEEKMNGVCTRVEHILGKTRAKKKSL